MSADRPVYKYRDDVLAELWKYGVRPTEHTPPELVRGFINEIYKFQLRKLRDQYVRGEFPKREYHRLVIEIRDRYPVLALLPRQWLLPGSASDAVEDDPADADPDPRLP